MTYEELLTILHMCANTGGDPKKTQRRVSDQILREIREEIPDDIKKLTYTSYDDNNNGLIKDNYFLITLEDYYKSKGY